MNKRRLRDCGRPKALFGAGESAAILAAAAINAGATTAGAALGAKAARDSAKQQAEATLNNAKKQAEALKEQNESQNDALKQQQEFVKEQYEQNREIAKDTQMLLQQQMGLENTNERLEASKIKVRNGGGFKRKLRHGVDAQSSLRGGNMNFIVTDGGYVTPIGETNEGFDLYEIKGNDHEHYHKTKSGKAKSGVGIRLNPGTRQGITIEGEGNQNGNNGELLLTTPEEALFISKHSVKGFNPAEAVRNGMHPVEAFNIQENIKSRYGISDGGNNRKKNKKIMGGTNINMNILDGSIIPNTDFSVDNMATTVTENSFLDNQRKLRYGGRIKYGNGGRVQMKWAGSANISGNTYTIPKKGNNNRVGTLWGIAQGITGKGTNWKALAAANPGINPNKLNPGQVITLPNDWGYSAPVSVPSIPVQSNIPTLDTKGIDKLGGFGVLGQNLNRGAAEIKGFNQTNQPVQQGGATPSKGGFFSNPQNVQFAAAGVGVLGNVLGGLISSSGNNSAAEIMADAQRQGAAIMSDAYKNLKGIDPSIVNAEDYRASHYMPAIHTARVNVNPELEDINRSMRKGIKAASDNSISGAARYKRISDMIDLSNQAKSRVYAKQSNLEEERRAQTAKQISEAAAQNAYLDTQANQNYTSDRMKIAQYNNDIENKKILGAAGAESEGAINAANVLGSAKSTNAGLWSNAITGSIQGFGNTLSDMATRRQNIDSILLGADTATKVNYLSDNGTDAQKASYIARFKKMLPNLSDENKKIYQNYIEMLSA